MKKKIALIVSVMALAVAVWALVVANANREEKRTEEIKKLLQTLKDFEGFVSYVYDGDTVLIKSHGVKITARLWGIDAPEKKQPGGGEALKYLRKITSRRKIKVVPIESDNYGRLIAKLYDGEKFINLEMIRSGNAWWYEHYSSEWSDGKKAQAEAKSSFCGIWGTKTPPVNPYLWRKSKRK